MIYFCEVFGIMLFICSGLYSCLLYEEPFEAQGVSAEHQITDPYDMFSLIGIICEICLCHYQFFDTSTYLMLEKNVL